MENLEQVLAYHHSTKHQFSRFARGPAYLDWETQPEPFRRYQGAPLLLLDRGPFPKSPPYESAFWEGNLEPATLDLSSVSRLFYDSLSLSAWKRAGQSTWSLRVNPSSGNLHPTEGYLLCGPAPGLADSPLVAHYAPREHALELRAEFPLATWQALTAGLPPDAILVGLSSIHWREAWKYGERAFRYCQHDVGHAIAALSLAAAGLGWQTRLLDDLGSEQLGHLLGKTDPHGVEAENPDCLLAVYPQGQTCSTLALPEMATARFPELTWQGIPNRLSRSHREWPLVDAAAGATEKPRTERASPPQHRALDGEGQHQSGCASPSLRQVVRQRRSAVAMDPRGTLDRDAFYSILSKTLARQGQFPFNTLPWRPMVHLLLFVHRIEGLAPGIYFLLRDLERGDALRLALKSSFAWETASSCPEGVALYRLATGDVQAVARQLSCNQAIAADGCFSLGMIAEFDGPLRTLGPWFYRRLFWECGMIGQVLYLEAEAAGVRGTGIGCFFDDGVHELLGLETEHYQSLYHFTVGHPIEDTRISTLPAYP